MKLENFFRIHGKIQWRQADKTKEVGGLSVDSRHLDETQIFVALRGTQKDGHDYLAEAALKKPLALVVEEIEGVPADYHGAVFEVLDTKVALHKLSRRFHGKPSKQLRSVAVTGTNGKSSFCYIYEALLQSIGSPCGVVGTIDHHLGEHIWPSDLTTPPPHLLQKRLADFVDLGADSFVMEVSSHALDQGRVQESFELCVFTNLSRDHLDYHADEEAYFQAKALLFGDAFYEKGSDFFGLVNGDDPAALRIPILTSRECFTFGKGPQHDFGFEVIEQKMSGTSLKLYFPNNQSLEMRSPLIGEYNAYNVVAALASVYLLRMNWKKAASMFHSFLGIPGRLERVANNREIDIFVDFAHSEDSLRRVLHLLKSLQERKDQRLVVVFGCGGDRDKGKRRFMGKVARQWADLVVVTSDNPRSEDPDTIIEEILEDMTQIGDVVVVEKDRKKALGRGLALCNKGDTLVICGKGHEKFQEIKGKKIPFDDVVLLRELLISDD